MVLATIIRPDRGLTPAPQSENPLGNVPSPARKWQEGPGDICIDT